MHLPVHALATRNYESPADSAEKPEMVTPEADDPVEFHAKGTVKSVANGMAHVHVKFINGKRVQARDSAQAANQPDEKGLLEMARQADREKH